MSDTGDSSAPAPSGDPTGRPFEPNPLAVPGAIDRGAGMSWALEVPDRVEQEPKKS